MTTLAITPNWKNKTAKSKGTVAAGEHVSVTIQNDNGEGEKVIDDASTLRLRVVGMDGRTLAIFPEPVPEGETPETWGEEDLTPLTCTLNLNTVQMLKAVPPAANVPLLFVLDDYDNKTLYFKEQFEVTHWPRRFGEEEPTPTDLDDYKDIIEDFNTRLTAAEQTVADAAANAQSAANSASAAAASAAAAATAATDAQTGAIAAKDAAQTAANDAASAKTAAEDAQDAAEDAQEAAETAQGKAQEYAEAAAESAATFVVDDTLSVEGAAADAKAVGEANQDLITQIETVQDNLDNEVAAREELDGAVQVDRQNLANEIARAQGAEQTLDANKADKATTYTKSEVDTKIAGVQTFKKYLVQTLPDPDEADMKGLYLVPTGETSEEGDLCEEWTVVEEDGEKRWEKIGGTTVDLSDYYDKDEVDGLLAGKASTADATLTQGYTDWACNPETSQYDDDYFVAWDTIPETEVYTWCLFRGDSEDKTFVDFVDAATPGLSDLTSATFTGTAGETVTATRTASGYVLGSQSDKPLASEAEAKALRQDKQDALTFDNAPTMGSNNPVKSGGIWTALWGTATTAFSSVYDWVVSILSEYRGKTDLNVYGLSDPVASFADGFSVSYGEGGDEQRYTAPSGGETVTFIGPVPSSSQYTPNDAFYYPSTLGTLDSFDPNDHEVWCLVCPNGGTTPSYMMYRTGPYYSIGSFNSETPTLTLGIGEATGDAPTMARPLGATGDTLAKASQIPAVTAPSTSSSASGKAADAKATGDALALKANDNAVVKLTGNQEIAGNKTFSGTVNIDSAAGGEFNIDNSIDDASAKLEVVYVDAQTGDILRAIITDGLGNTHTVAFPSASGTLALTSAIPYDLVAKTISNNAVTLDDRAINAVAVSSSLASLTVNFPTATSGKVRDFGLRLTVASGITTAPQLVLPQGVSCENADGAAPEIGADGAATILYFTETASGVFLVKGEVVTAIS